jgi:mRNA-degrading endonuclease RelE of RelBE toxin-antitoxin system
MVNDPFDGDVKPLKGVAGVFRRRVGDYRIAFSVNFDQNEVLVLKVGRRGKFYNDM